MNAMVMNLAISDEGRRSFPAYLVGSSLYLPSQLWGGFDAEGNLAEVIESVLSAYPVSEDLAASAAGALARMSNRNETPEEWAKRLADDLFEDRVD